MRTVYETRVNGALSCEMEGKLEPSGKQTHTGGSMDATVSKVESTAEGAVVSYVTEIATPETQLMICAHALSCSGRCQFRRLKRYFCTAV